MSDAAAAAAPRPKTPWHVWAVGVLALLWNASGAWTIVMAQAGRLPLISAEEAAYYAAQPLWFVIVTDIATLGAVLAALLLLLRSRFALWLFAVSLVCILVTNAYDLSMGSSRALASRGAMIVTVIIVILAVLELLYAWAMRRKGVLR